MKSESQEKKIYKNDFISTNILKTTHTPTDGVRRSTSSKFVISGTGACMLLRRLILRNDQPRFTMFFQILSAKDIDRSLIFGAGIFGLGWGLGGFCPGPGLTSIFSGHINPILFLVGMSAGILAAPKVESLLIPQQIQSQS